MARFLDTYFNKLALIFINFHVESLASIILCLSVVQQNMRVTRRIVMPLLTKALYEFGCFERDFAIQIMR